MLKTDDNIFDKIEDWFLDLKFIKKNKIDELYFKLCRVKGRIMDFIYHNPINFMRNVIQYRKFLVNNHWFDYAYLIDMLRIKLSIDAKKYRERGIALEADKFATQMEYCVELLNRIHDDEYELNCMDEYELDSFKVDKKKTLECLKQAREERDKDIKDLFDYIGDNILYWWD